MQDARPATMVKEIMATRVAWLRKMIRNRRESLAVNPSSPNQPSYCCMSKGGLYQAVQEEKGWAPIWVSLPGASVPPVKVWHQCF